MTYLAVAIISLLLGSFYNVCIHRIQSGKSIVYPPSHCPSCNHTLGPLDLVPVFSYMILLGKCRYCRERISPRYPIVELLTSISYILMYKTLGLTWSFAAYSVLLGILIITTFIDIEQQIIPNILIVIGLVTGCF